MVGAPSFIGAGCGTGCCLMVTNVRERLSVSKRAARKFDVERFNLQNVNGVTSKFKITSVNAALENLM